MEIDIDGLMRAKRVRCMFQKTKTAKKGAIREDRAFFACPAGVVAGNWGN
jgi:hypothetical protein